jgi:hypothetical protein
MVQQFVLCNLSFAHLCLEQINFIDVQIAWYGKGIEISIIGPWYKIMINQRFGKNPPKGTQLHITKKKKKKKKLEIFNFKWYKK